MKDSLDPKQDVACMCVVVRILVLCVCSCVPDMNDPPGVVGRPVAYSVCF